MLTWFFNWKSIFVRAIECLASKSFSKLKNFIINTDLDFKQVTTEKLNNIIENNTWVLGLRPVANIIWEKPSTVPLLVFKENEPSADFVIAWGDSSVWNSIPLTDICSETKSLICRHNSQFECEESSLSCVDNENF